MISNEHGHSEQWPWHAMFVLVLRAFDEENFYWAIFWHKLQARLSCDVGEYEPCVVILATGLLCRGRALVEMPAELILWQLLYFGYDWCADPAAQPIQEYVEVVSAAPATIWIKFLTEDFNFIGRKRLIGQD